MGCPVVLQSRIAKTEISSVKAFVVFFFIAQNAPSHKGNKIANTYAKKLTSKVILECTFV